MPVFVLKFLERRFQLKENAVSAGNSRKSVNSLSFPIDFSGQFYDDYLKKIIKNDQTVDWLSMDLSYLEKVWFNAEFYCVIITTTTKTMMYLFFFQKRYDEEFQSRIDRCPVITISELNEKNLTMNCAQILYSKNKEFVVIANVLRLMNDFKVRFLNLFVFEHKCKLYRSFSVATLFDSRTTNQQQQLDEFAFDSFQYFLVVHTIFHNRFVVADLRSSSSLVEVQNRVFSLRSLSSVVFSNSIDERFRPLTLSKLLNKAPVTFEIRSQLNR